MAITGVLYAFGTIVNLYRTVLFLLYHVMYQAVCEEPVYHLILWPVYGMGLSVQPSKLCGLTFQCSFLMNDYLFVGTKYH